MKHSLASGPVRPADCLFPHFRSTYLAAAAWSVVDGTSSSNQVDTSSAVPVMATAGRCEPSVRASLNQRMHIRSIDKLDIQQLAHDVHQEEGTGPKEELQARREKFEFFEKHCSRVYEGLYLGSDAVAQNKQLLQQHGVTHVVNCVGFLCGNYHASVMTYKTLFLQDTPNEDILCILYHVFDFLEEAYSAGGRTYVHCSQGVSRSASCVIAYLMYKLQQPYDVVFKQVKQARGVANPNIGFICQLLQWHKRRTTPLTQGDLRIYQVTPQSQWAPGFLVARALKPGGTELLDQRGAFLIHTHQCVYVWQGGQCPAPMAADAQGLAAQLVRYEAPEGTRVEVVQGGQEPEGLAVLLQAASEAGEVKDTLRAAAEVNKRMAAYDAWYKMYEEYLTTKTTPGSARPDHPNAPQSARSHATNSGDTPRSNPKTPREAPEPGAGSPNNRVRKAPRGSMEEGTPRTARDEDSTGGEGREGP